MTLQPGKGFRIPLTMDLVEHIAAVMEELQEAMDAFATSPDLPALVADLESKNWESGEDKYGTKIWCDFEYAKDNVLRVQVVISKDFKAKIDIRDWWEN